MRPSSPSSGQRVTHLDRRTDGAQGVVFVNDRHTEDGHYGVADELLDNATVSLDDRRHPLEVPGKE